MHLIKTVLRLGAWVAFLVLMASTVPPIGQAEESTPMFDLEARVVAVGIPGISGIRQVGRFHPGGAIPGNPDFAKLTQPGQVLTPERLLVTSQSNFGAPLGIPSQPSGSILSVNPQSRIEGPLVLPPDFAQGGGQVSTLEGDVQLYTAQSPAFLNRHHNPTAATAMQPSVSNPRYISINNAFGRPWFVNAPHGLDETSLSGMGTSTVIDPTGHPLAGPPSAVAGGVFAGIQTNRSHQIQSGDLMSGAISTAFLGPSPDDTGFAVFAVVKQDGSVVQIHVRDGVDGLAPSETVLYERATVDLTRKASRGLPLAVGAAFNWVPTPILYLTDGPANRIAALYLAADGQIFHLAKIRHLEDDALLDPIDLAPAMPEVANPRFSSHTTLAGGSDLFVANRGDGTVVRMTQAGDITAKARIQLSGSGLLENDVAHGLPTNLTVTGLAVSADGQRLWLALDGSLPDYPNHPGIIVEIPAFDADGPINSHPRYRLGQPIDHEQIEKGRLAFTNEFTPEQGLGPLFNQQSCVACHNAPTVGGMGAAEQSMMNVRVGHFDPNQGKFDLLYGAGGPVARFRSIAEFGHEIQARPGIPLAANVASLRLAPALYGVAMLEQISNEAILTHAVDKGDGIHGRVNWINSAGGEQVIGRYGWKADMATLDEMIALALANELGVTTPLAPQSGRLPREDASAGQAPELGQSNAHSDDVDNDGRLIHDLHAFITSLEFPK